MIFKVRFKRTFSGERSEREKRLVAKRLEEKGRGRPNSIMPWKSANENGSELADTMEISQ